jgi:hypothetical protein
MTCSSLPTSRTECSCPVSRSDSRTPRCPTDFNMFADIGVLSSLLQGGFVRPRLSKHKTSELTFTQQGIYSCTVSLALMAILPLTGVRDSRWSSWVLYAIATGLSYTSATAVTGMMGAAAACCDDVEDEADQRGKLPRGKALGRFRSAVSIRKSPRHLKYEQQAECHSVIRVNWAERSVLY